MFYFTGRTSNTLDHSGALAVEGKLRAAYTVMVGCIALITFLQTGARLAGVVQVFVIPGNQQ